MEMDYIYLWLGLVSLCFMWFASMNINAFTEDAEQPR